jgi:hypothetical protein
VWVVGDIEFCFGWFVDSGWIVLAVDDWNNDIDARRPILSEVWGEVGRLVCTRLELLLLQYLQEKN